MNKKMITDYMDLEKVRYGNRLFLSFEVNGNTCGKLIPPLLILPFVENSFKHGAAKALRFCWINVTVTIEDRALVLDVHNTLPQGIHYRKERIGIGQANVKKRLDLLYPEKNNLIIRTTEKLYSVHMRIPLNLSA